MSTTTTAEEYATMMAAHKDQYQRHEIEDMLRASTRGILERMTDAFRYLDSHSSMHYIDIINDVEKITYKGYALLKETEPKWKFPVQKQLEFNLEDG